MNSRTSDTAARRAIGLLIATTFVVGAAALAFHLWLFPPRYTGWSEVAAGGTEVAGWVVDARAAHAPVRVQLYIDDRVIGSTLADLPRPDVVRAGFASDVRCGYRFAVPPLAPGAHVARVYVLHAPAGGERFTLQPTGEPLRFYAGEP